MTETRYYASTSALRELLESPAIDEDSKASIRLEVAHRGAACIAINPAALKSLRETLCVAQTALGGYGDDVIEHRDRLGQIIDGIDRHRPLGPDGKHGDLHTDTCGCEDKR